MHPRCILGASSPYPPGNGEAPHACPHPAAFEGPRPCLGPTLGAHFAAGAVGSSPCPSVAVCRRRRFIRGDLFAVHWGVPDVVFTCPATPPRAAALCRLRGVGDDFVCPRAMWQTNWWSIRHVAVHLGSE
eukprot:gene13068-biopygen1963